MFYLVSRVWYVISLLIWVVESVRFMVVVFFFRVWVRLFRFVVLFICDVLVLIWFGMGVWYFFLCCLVVSVSSLF